MIYGDPPHTPEETVVQTYMTCTAGVARHVVWYRM